MWLASGNLIKSLTRLIMKPIIIKYVSASPLLLVDAPVNATPHSDTKNNGKGKEMIQPKGGRVEEGGKERRRSVWSSTCEIPCGAVFASQGRGGKTYSGASRQNTVPANCSDGIFLGTSLGF